MTTSTIRPRFRSRLVAAPLALVLTLSAVPLGVLGCAAGWWQSITSNPAGAISTFLTFVVSFLQGAAAIWNMIFPLIPLSAQPGASTAFNNTVVTVTQAVAILEDAIRAAAAAQQATPDFGKLVANVQDAIAALMKIIAQWQSNGASGASGVSSDAGAASAVAISPPGYADLVRQAGVIASWK